MIALDVVRVTVTAHGVGEDRAVRLRITSAPHAQDRHEPQRHSEHAQPGFRLGPLHGQALTLNPDERSRNGDQMPLKIDVRPGQRQGFTDPTASAQEEPHQVRKIDLTGKLTVDQDRQPGPTLQVGQRPRFTARRALQGLHITHRAVPHRVTTDAKPQTPEATERHNFATE